METLPLRHEHSCRIRQTRRTGFEAADGGVFDRAELRIAIDAKVDSARVANEPALSMGIGGPRLDFLGVYARRPWLMRIVPASPPPMLAIDPQVFQAISDAFRGESSARVRATLANMPTATASDQLTVLRTRAIARVAGLNTADATLSASLEALARDSSLSPSERWESAYLAMQPRIAGRDTAGVGNLLARLSTDTLPRARLFERSIVAQRNLAFGVPGAVDSLGRREDALVIAQAAGDGAREHARDGAVARGLCRDGEAPRIAGRRVEGSGRSGKAIARCGGATSE